MLPLFSRKLEKLMHHRLMQYIIKYKFLCEDQFGFQKGKSTEHAILDPYSNRIKAIENHEKQSCIFLDFAKAFDAVNHNILLGKLEYYGIRGWFKSYLNKRTQTTKIDSSYSNYNTINCGGVPQGSVGGPLVFLIYVNDIRLSAPEVTFHLSADDKCIFYSHKNLDPNHTG